MIQAVGRGRLLRTDNVVNLYCGLPLKGASQEKITILIEKNITFFSILLFTIFIFILYLCI